MDFDGAFSDAVEVARFDGDPSVDDVALDAVSACPIVAISELCTPAGGNSTYARGG